MAKLAAAISLVALAGTMSGCAGTPSPGQSRSGAIRTVSIDVPRDTAAAQRANSAGLAHLAKGDLDKAAKAFSEALSHDTTFGPAHNNLGKINFARQAWHRAAWEFERAAKLMPRSAAPRNNLGLVLEETGDLDWAIEQYRDAVALDDGPIEYRANLARAMIRRGDDDREVAMLLRQIVVEDTRPEWIEWATRQLTRIGAAGH